MKQKRLTIPKFSSIQEEAKFWDSHDATVYFDQMEDIKAKFALKSSKAESVTIRLQPEIKRRLVNMAKEWGVSSSTLLRMWAVEKLRRPQFPVQRA
jgi:hypothetical protein